MLPALLLALAPLQESLPRTYHAWLDTPGGALGFGLELEPHGAGWTAFLRNGEERLQVPQVVFDGEQLLLDLPHYDSRIRARVVAEVRVPQGPQAGWVVASSGSGLEGVWEKRRGPESTARVPFFATQPLQPAFDHRKEPVPSLAGRWAVRFATDDQPSVAVFSAGPGTGELRGTFLNATGDYRYLSGSQQRYETDDQLVQELMLSCFDGAHAFLFKAQLQADGSLKGDFWSGNWHHETWSAKRDDAAELADPFAQTTWNGRTRLADLAFPGLDGTKRSLADPEARATLLVVFGSWCPNCNDEAALLKELDATYRERGLRILLLAFELTGDFRRDAEQVRIFQERHGLAELPAFLCGTADKAEATKALGLVDRVRAFPTTIFVGADGLPKAIHSGFAGPATGEEHQKLRRDFAARIEALLPPR